jgi:putative flippase GtrA
MIQIFRQFLKFVGVGLISLAVHYGTLVLLVRGADAPPVPASSIGFLLGGLVNYLLNCRFTFGGTESHLESGFRFAVLVGIGVVMNSALMWIGVDRLHLHYLLSQVAATGLLTVWNFFANRHWAFRSGRQKQG